MFLHRTQYLEIYTSHNKIPEEFSVISIDPGTISFALYVEKIVNNQRKPRLLITENLNKNGYPHEALLRLIDDHQELFDQCHVLLLERQMKIQMNRFFQHIETAFLIKCPHLVIIECKATMKTQVLAPKLKFKRNKRMLQEENDIKWWSVKRALNFLEERRAQSFIDLMTRNKHPNNDCADAIVQCEALIEHLGCLTN